MSVHSRSESGAVKRQPNGLIDEKSPYLLQHAHNPVDWYPWGEEAFEKAAAENKPVFLSIGYSTCHWCHVMAHESFEDPEVAAVLNETFVCVKVDREERPDLDQVYMAVCQMMTGGGGWPLTVIMTPDKKPFFAGTYFPRRSRFGQTGIMELVPKIRDIWSERHGEVLASAEAIAQAVRQSTHHSDAAPLDEPVLRTAYVQLADRFDEEHGGFGGAPKFPTPHNLFFLLRYWKRAGEEKALQMVLKTLRAMRMGGIYDQVGFGFHRYSTDAEWVLPHFEKMLYDQAMAAIAYLEANQATGDRTFETTAREIFEYVLRDMSSPEGGFYSAEDADSEGEEGKFYVWTEEELEAALGEEDAGVIMKVFNVSPGGNYRDQTTGRRTGSNILHMEKAVREMAAEFGFEEGELEERVESARGRLFVAREKRVRPHKDDKILVDWNGLMIAALAKAGRVLGEASYIEAAQNAADFITGKMRGKGGRLHRRYRDGEAAVTAVLDDYAFLVWGLLELYEATFEVCHLETAAELTEEMIDNFWDDDAGGFFFTSADGEQLLVRRKETYDGATPSGNSVALLDLLTLARIKAEAGLDEKAAVLLSAFSGSVKQALPGHSMLLTSLDFALGPSVEVVVVGREGAPDTEAMLSALGKEFLPNKVVLFKADGEESPPIVRLARFTERQASIDGRATAYVCRDHACEAPTTDTLEMLRLIGADNAG